MGGDFFKQPKSEYEVVDLFTGRGAEVRDWATDTAQDITAELQRMAEEGLGEMQGDYTAPEAPEALTEAERILTELSQGSGPLDTTQFENVEDQLALAIKGGLADPFNNPFYTELVKSGQGIAKSEAQDLMNQLIASSPRGGAAIAHGQTLAAKTARNLADIEATIMNRGYEYGRESATQMASVLAQMYGIREGAALGREQLRGTGATALANVGISEQNLEQDWRMAANQAAELHNYGSAQYALSALQAASQTAMAPVGYWAGQIHDTQFGQSPFQAFMGTVAPPLLQYGMSVW